MKRVVELNHFRECLKVINRGRLFKVLADSYASIYVDLMYELTQGGRLYSDLYLYNEGYGATIPQDPGINRVVMWTDTDGNLLKIRDSHSGVFMFRTYDNRWSYIFSSSRIEEMVHKYERLLRKGEHWNKQLQYYYDIEDGNLDIEILELCPKRFLRIAKKKWCKYYGQSIARKFNPVNKDFREEEMV